MIRIASKLKKHGIINSVFRSKLTYHFSQSPEPQGISLKSIVESVKQQSIKIYNVFKKFNYYQYVGLFLFATGLLYTLNQSNQELYPINYFEEEILSYGESINEFKTSASAPKIGFDQITVKIIMSTKSPQYKIYFIKNDHKYYVDYSDQIQRFQNLIKAVSNSNVRINYQYTKSTQLLFTNIIIAANIISVAFITAYFLKTSSMTNIKQSKNSMNVSSIFGNKKTFQVVTNTQVKFNDVAGLDESKVEVQQFVDFLKNPEKYKKLGARIPKGVLLSGPPGTGKTMLAKACAGEAGVPFIATSGSDFVEIFVGVGASRVRDLFGLAKQKSPAIIFIDEIDAVGRKRSGSHGSHDERDNTLNQILVEMDGFETSENVIVMAATNRQNLLDTALIRPGRFDRMVQINLPDLEGRRQIFNVHLQKVKVQDSRTKDEYSRRLATLTPGFSGAQIANLCNQAAILAARHDKKHVDSHDLQMATERIIGGVERKSIISKDEKRIVAVHESGHAVVSWFLKGADPLLKLTIIPRSKGSLGFAQYFVNQTKLNTKNQLIDRICFILGGRCAQEHFFGKITNGASDDLKKAYELAHNIVVKLGMNEQIGYIGYKDAQYLRPYSEEMGAKIDQQIIKIIDECTQRTRSMVKQYEKEIKQLSDELYDKQTLTIRQIRRILGERDFTSNVTYEQYLQIEKDLQSSPKQV